MKKYAVILFIFFIGTASFAQKKKDLIKEVAALKSQKAEIQKKLLTLQKAKEVDMDNELHNFSYALGVTFGSDLKDAGADSIHYSAFTTGIEDVIKGMEKISAKDANNQVRETMKTMENARNEKLKAKGITFLTENAKRPEIKTTDSGLQYEILTTGNGVMPKETERVKVHYAGSLINGTEFDSSIARGEPAEFGVNQVIKGWTEALKLMPQGSKWKLYIPYELAYGERGVGNGLIPPFSTLVFEVELLEVLKGK